MDQKNGEGKSLVLLYTMCMVFPFYLLKKSGIFAEGTNRTKLNPELKSSRQWIRDFQEYI